MHFVAAEETKTETEPAEIRQRSCQVDGRGWSCELPPGTWDVRLDARGMSPAYRLDRRVEAGETTRAEPFELRPASRVTGWVRADGALRDVSVRISPVGASSEQEPGARRRLEWLASLSVEADERGRFELDGLAPGVYRVIAESGETGELQSRDVRVEIDDGGTSVELPEPLDLHPTTTLRITLEPPLDPWGEPWRVELHELTDDPGRTEKRVEGRAEHGGFWVGEGHRPGSYRLHLRDSQGGPWHSQPLTLGSAAEELYLPIDVVEVRGRIARGSEPLETELYFGRGRPAIRMQSDPDGFFEGSLPREGEWHVHLGASKERITLEPVEVRRREGKSYAELEILVPDTEIRGQVVDGEGPTPAAVVAFRGALDPRNGQDRRREIALFTDEEGRFEIRGVSPGDLRIRASRGEETSNWRHVEVREERPVEVELVISERREVAGLALVGGRPAGGVRIQAQPPGTFGVETVSGIDGRFRLRLPPGVEVLDILAVQAGGAVSMHRLDVSKDSPLQLRLPRASGDLVFVQMRKDAFLGYGGVMFPLAAVQASLGPGRARPHPAGGIGLSGMSAGRWFLCDTPRITERCSTAEVPPGGSAVIQPLDNTESP